ncbi:hypothetical protein K0M31_015747 [Melipona bicolor]|uniref:Uncharacterized protein n=1 Tax=Melipona bicolor TaxID=60889 RepID=A0AA40FF08_9HYME|nr:hypothetical protein K0M31_015747 [Melipona bicolor]
MIIPFLDRVNLNSSRGIDGPRQVNSAERVTLLAAKEFIGTTAGNVVPFGFCPEEEDRAAGGAGRGWSSPFLVGIILVGGTYVARPTSPPTRVQQWICNNISVSFSSGSRFSEILPSSSDTCTRDK